MIIVSNCIPVARGHEKAFAERFRNRASLVEHHPGFVRLEILRPQPISMHGKEMGRSDYHVVLTYWETEAGFIAWTESQDFRTAHPQRAPQEMFAGKHVFELHEIIQSATRIIDH